MKKRAGAILLTGLLLLSGIVQAGDGELKGQGLGNSERKAAMDEFLKTDYNPEEWKLMEVGVSNACYHYLGSAKIMARIGKAFAEALIGLEAGDVVIRLPDAGEMRFRLLPAGRFMMGSPEGEKDGGGDEKPVHEVLISQPFHLGIHEVTCAQWKLVMGSLPEDAGDDPGAAVSGVGWEDCQVFIRRLGERGIGTFRLPTEAEWEYACRAGTTTRFHWGSDPDFSLADEYAWHKGNAGGRARKVGMKKPNAWGLHDMSGNAWEWCSDWYGPYPSGRQVDPKGPQEGKTHVMRGNGWRWGPKYCRSANRFDRAEGHATGLRLVLTRKADQ